MEDPDHQVGLVSMVVMGLKDREENLEEMASLVCREFLDPKEWRGTLVGRD